ncbi:phage tail tape measure protein [Streptococcus parauberis]|uniref:phage tail tape measure protein n=1 Tax=Streptococcus parauberis TaxID=1348 RepID=UPI0037A1F8D0
MANIGDLVATASLDIAPFEGSMKHLQMSVRGLDKMLKTVETSTKNYGDKLSGLKATQSQVSQSLSAYQAILKKQSDKYDKVKASITDMNTATTKQKEDLLGARNAMAETANKVSDLQNKYSALGREIAIQSSIFTKAGNSLQTFGNKLGSISSTTGKISSATRDMSLIIGAGMGYGIKQASEFNNSMTATQALLADTVPASQMNAVITKLGDNSKKWAMEYGLSTKSVNAGMQELVKAGYDANQVTASMPAILNASKASGEDFNTVMQATTSILSQYGLGAKEAGRVTDSLSYVANKTKAGFKDMGDAMVYVGPVAKSVGMNVEQTASAIGILSNAGIQGEKAGTALRGALTRLLKPSKQNAVAMQELGFSAEEFKKGQIDLPDVIDRIKKSTEGMTDAEKASLIAKAFGTESQTAMNALVNEGSDALRGLTKETKGATGYTKELAKAMNSTDAAKFEKAKAKMEVLAITIGQKLLPTIVPLVEDIADLASKFADLPEPVQDNILKLGMFLAVVSPISGAISKTTGLLGGLSGGFGKVLGALGKVGAEKGAVTALEGVATSAGGASASVGLLGNPVTWGVILGGATVLALGLIADSMYKAHQRTQEWGTKVSEVQAGQLSQFKTKVDETNQAMIAFGGTSKDVDTVKSAFQGLVTEIEKLENKDLAKKLNVAEKLGLSQDTINEIKQSSQQTVANAQQMSDEVINIYKNASEQKRTITAEENKIVTQNQNELIKTQLSLMKYSSKERIAITKAMNGEIDQLNNKQLQSALATTEKWIKSENKSYKTQKQALKDMYAEIKGTDKDAVKARKEIHDNIETLEAGHQAKMDAYGKKYAKIRKKLIEDDLKTMDPSQRAIYTDMVEKQMKKLGLSYDELMSKSNKNVSKMVKDNTLWAKTTKESSNEQVLANKVWKGLTFDDKTGKFKTNAKEEIAKALEAKGGWENLKFVAKNANLSTNARITMAEVLIEKGKWDTLTPAEKKLIVDGHEGIQAIVESKANLDIWNSMPEKVKKILGNNKDFINKKEVATQMLQSWNALSPQEKKLLAKNMTAKDVKSAQSTINSLKGKTVDAKAKDATHSGVSSAKSNIDSVKGKTVTITSIFKNIYEKITKNEKGTNFHPGGLAMVNDQKGSTYRELVIEPDGTSYIPTGRNVVLPLKRGSKVLKASKTKQLFPHYANGIGFDNTNISRLTKRMGDLNERNITVKQETGNFDSLINAIQSKSNSDLMMILQAIEAMKNRPVVVSNVMNDREISRQLAEPLMRAQESLKISNARLRGELQ